MPAVRYLLLSFWSLFQRTGNYLTMELFSMLIIHPYFANVTYIYRVGENFQNIAHFCLHCSIFRFRHRVLKQRRQNVFYSIWKYQATLFKRRTFSNAKVTGLGDSYLRTSKRITPMGLFFLMNVACFLPVSGFNPPFRLTDGL